MASMLWLNFFVLKITQTASIKTSTDKCLLAVSLRSLVSESFIKRGVGTDDICLTSPIMDFNGASQSRQRPVEWKPSP